MAKGLLFNRGLRKHFSVSTHNMTNTQLNIYTLPQLQLRLVNQVFTTDWRTQL